jgi:hypothetical protein
MIITRLISKQIMFIMINRQSRSEFPNSSAALLALSTVKWSVAMPTVAQLTTCLLSVQQSLKDEGINGAM